MLNRYYDMVLYGIVSQIYYLNNSKAKYMLLELLLFNADAEADGW